MNTESVEIREESSIVWLEDPNKYDYLRQSVYNTTRRRGGVSNTFFKTLGYEEQLKKGKGIQVYERKVWFLKRHDRGCPDEIPLYAPGSLMPEEAVLVKDIVSLPNDQIHKYTKEVKNSEVH
ncbi:MAG: hypothetical protein SYNGOMJ08_00384 [Candidatus Syntrophoarchaeum sp. GoM_oil]|nr:MAG: hypothetical protein SYNGOMJ08_00384 [Candidatus Syntrophoarchaeum sp. GoM_oil]